MEPSGRGLDGDKAPCTVDSFIYLAAKNFFDGTSCHRLTTGALKVLQCGDPTGTGSGGPAYEYDEEVLPGLRRLRAAAELHRLRQDHQRHGRPGGGRGAGTDTANGESDGAPKKKVTLQDVTIAGGQARRVPVSVDLVPVSGDLVRFGRRLIRASPSALVSG